MDISISLTKKREAKIQTNFSRKSNSIIQPTKWIDTILEELKSKSRGDEETDNNDNYETNVNNVFGENSIHDRLIVFDDVSGLAAIQKNLQVFWLLLENTITITYIFFIRFTPKKQIGERFYHRQIFIIFFLQPFLSIVSEKF